MAVDLPRTLVVTNDYPPRVGGIQRTLEALVRQFPSDRVAVLCPAWEGASSFDAAGGYRVFRQPERFLWPTPDAGRRIRVAIAEFGAEVVLFSAACPLAYGPAVAARAPYLSRPTGSSTGCRSRRALTPCSGGRPRGRPACR
jgi:phosphatidylinositol alpha-1,6-mannosyltransferase